MKVETIVTRIAPSPTGPLHVGTARSALFNFLFATQNNGKFILRIEDTDKERSKPEFEKNILDSLKFLDIKYDEIYRQSERGDIYEKYIKELIEKEVAYVSKEESRNNPGEQVDVVRLKNPNKEITFNDVVRGDITFDTTDLGDFVIARSVKDPLYHLAVVIDDYDMGINYIIRGDDHISNTPRQILIQEALGFPRPKYAHMPMILAPDKSKLSKRHGAVSVTEYSKDFLPEAIVNYLALLGWNPGTNQEIFTMNELIEKFDISKMQKGGAIFDIEKLKSINHAYLQKLSISEFKDLVFDSLKRGSKEVANLDDEMLEKILRIAQERTQLVSDIEEFARAGDFDFYYKNPEYDSEELQWKTDHMDDIRGYIDTVIELLSKVNEDDFTIDTIKNAIWDYATEIGRGSVLWPMRYALTGREKSPDPFNVAEILGKEITLERLRIASNKIS